MNMAAFITMPYFVNVVIFASPNHTFPVKGQKGLSIYTKVATN